MNIKKFGRVALVASATLVAGSGLAIAAPKVVATAHDPLHHVIHEDQYIRLMRVMIPPGKATEFHEQHLDYVNTILQGSHVRIDKIGIPEAENVEMKTNTIRFGAHQGHSYVDKVTNVDTVVNEQVAFEIKTGTKGNFGPADRTKNPAFVLALDKPRVRGWHVVLAPGETTGQYTQSGPGVRVIVTGERMIVTPPNDIGHDVILHPKDGEVTEPGTRTITNGGDTPLEFYEYELL